jgi:hypothetical protein
MDDNNASITRSRVFVLLDGSFVVRWSENQVQDLLTGQYREFERRRDYGAPITDFELNQLKQAGIVDEFDREQVWLSPSPERSRFYKSNMRQRVRSYYLNTTLPGLRLSEVESVLVRLGLDKQFLARTRDDFVVILGHQGRAFANFDEAEQARYLLVEQAAEIFKETVVAFVEAARHD